jgi:hypothetical protein
VDTLTTGRKRTQEVTKSSSGIYLVVTWEWNNGWNLVDSRRATAQEIVSRQVQE